VDAYEQLRRELASWPDAWKPEPGEVLAGIVVSVVERRGFAERPYPAVTVRTEEGELTFHGYHTVAKDELAQQRPEPGDMIGIAYHGLFVDGEKRYERYRIKVVKPDVGTSRPTGPDWGRYGADAEQEKQWLDAAPPALDGPATPQEGLEMTGFDLTSDELNGQTDDIPF
jgi:hypothetical protein